MAKIRANLFTTEDGFFVLTLLSPNVGWRYLHYKLLDINAREEVEILGASDLNIKSDVMPILTKLYGINTTLNSVVVNAFENLDLKIVEDVSLALLGINKGDDFSPYPADYKDVSGQSLSAYVNSLGRPVSLVNKSWFSYSPKSFDLQSHNPWSSKEISNDPEMYKPVINDLLYDSVKQSKAFKSIIKYIDKSNPLEKFKNIGLIGAPGSGKSVLVRAVARFYNLPYAEVVMDRSMTAEDITGQTVAVVGDGGSPWRFVINPLIWVRVAGGVAFIDEVTNASAPTQNALNSGVSNEQRFVFANGIKYLVHEKTIHFFAANVGLEGNSLFNQAFFSRFHRVKMKKLTVDEISEFYVKSFNMDPTQVKAAIEFMEAMDAELAKSFSMDGDNADHIMGFRPEIDMRERNRFVSDLFHSFYEFGTVLPAVEEEVGNLLISDLFNDSHVENFVKKLSPEISKLDDALAVSADLISQGKALWKSISKPSSVSIKIAKKVSSKSATDKADDEVAKLFDGNTLI